MEGEENRFGRKKFIKMLKEMAKRLYPGQSKAYETLLYEKLTRAPDPEEHRIKLDETTKKLLTRETIAKL